MVDLSTRSTQEEIMDNLSSKGEIIDQTLKELDVINKYLGGNQITINGLKKLRNNSSSLKIVDIGCGSGEMLHKIYLWGKKNNISLDLIGVDANPHIIKYARKNNPSEINFVVNNIFDPSFSKERFDVILATLITHHFTTDQLIFLLTQWKNQATTGIVINDLHRHILAYQSIRLLTNVFSKSTMVKNDAPLSVARSFRKEDWQYILSEAGITNYTLTWKWAFRWDLIIYKH